MNKKANVTKNTIEDEPVNKNIDETLDKAANSCSLGTNLNGPHSSAKKKPNENIYLRRNPCQPHWHLTSTPIMTMRIMNHTNPFSVGWPLYQ